VITRIDEIIGTRAKDPDNSDDGNELLCQVTRKITEMTEYGVSFEALIAGKVAPPPEGARFGVAFEGAANGPKLKGVATAVDYVVNPSRLRARAKVLIRRLPMEQTHQGAS
jgi:hypothetical protein